jgi:hypothetical protein
MNDGMFIALRGLGQETNSLLMQLLAEQRRTNEMLSQLGQPLDFNAALDKRLNEMMSEDAEPTVKPKAAAKKGK